MIYYIADEDNRCIILFDAIYVFPITNSSHKRKTN